MAACDLTRPLTQAQLEAGFAQQRTGVGQALRPFSGSPTVENLIDYCNRELVPVLRATRNAANDVWKQVVDNAPSANPLAFYFSTTTANADPTAGRVRLNQAVQNTATIIRVSESNGRLQNVQPWLDVMSGGPTTPLGTITLLDSINPGRFLRFDLNTMADQGAYWNLGVTFIEGSDASPFTDDEAVTIGFIAGVSAAGSTVPVGSLSPVPRDTFLSNIGTTTAPPSANLLADIDSTSIVYDATAHEMQRAALTGFAASTQNSNATTSAEPIVTYSASANMSAERVTTSSTSVTVDTSVASQIQFQRAALTGEATAAANANAVTVTRSTDFNTSPWTGNHAFNGAVALGGVLSPATWSTQQNDLAIGNINVLRVAMTGDQTLTGMVPATNGQIVVVQSVDTADILTIAHASTASAAANRFSLPETRNLQLENRAAATFRYDDTSSVWRCIGISRAEAGRLIARTTYTSGSGTHTYDTRCSRAKVRMKGGGGGGGGAGAPDGNVAGGGGEGGYEELDITSVPTSSAYAVGAAGTAGSSSSGTGGTGGSTTFNDGSVTRTAAGGTGGIAGGVIGEGGDGGSVDAIGGTVSQSCKGAPGMFGWLDTVAEGHGGNGGGSGAGKGGFGSSGGTVSEAGAAAGTNSGAGGGGGARPASPNVAGGAGGAGWIVVEEFS